MDSLPLSHQEAQDKIFLKIWLKTYERFQSSEDWGNRYPREKENMERWAQFSLSKHFVVGIYIIQPFQKVFGSVY